MLHDLNDCLGSGEDKKKERPRVARSRHFLIGPLHDPVTSVRNKLHWEANYAVGLSKQRKVGLDWYEFLFFLKVPLRNLRPSVIYSVPCDRIV